MLPLRFLLIPLLFLLLVLPSCAHHDDISGLSHDTLCPDGLALEAVEPSPLDPDRAEAELRLIFRGVPALGSLRDQLSFELDGVARAPELTPDPDDPSAVWLRVPIEPEAGAARDLAPATLRRSQGTACDGAADVLAPPARHELTMVSDPAPVRIGEITVHEGQDGHYLEVRCEDWSHNAAGTPPGTRGERCLPDLEANPDAIVTDPRLPLELAATVYGFTVYAPFAQGPLTLRFAAGLTTVDGGTLRREHSVELEIPALEPRLSFVSQGRYLPRAGLGRVAIRHRNVPAAELRVRHVPSDNLLFWHSGREPADSRSSDLVLVQELVLEGEADSEAVTWLDLEQLLPDAREGLVELTLRGHGGDEDEDDDPDVYDGWWGPWADARAAVRVLLTDLQIVAKREATAPGQAEPAGLWVWALDAHGDGPIAGVTMELVRPSGAVTGRCRTDARGGCHLTSERDPVDPEPAFAIVARKGADTSVLELDELELDQRGDIQGMPYLDGAELRAAAWTDRGVYRPGDTVLLSAILRGPDDLAPPDGQPVALRWLDSRGRELRRTAAAGNAAGMFEAELDLQDYARTGRYRAQLLLADRTVGETSFMVEEIVPERMRVQLDAPRTDLLPQELAELGLEAHWLFGSPAAGARTELSCRLVPARFSATTAPSLHFGSAELPGSSSWSREPTRSRGALDDAGRSAASCPPAEATGPLPGPATLYARAEVFEGATGRSSKGRARITVHPERFHIGLQAHSEAARPGQPVQVEGLVVGWDGQADPDATDRVSVEIQRLEREHSWTWDSQDQDYRYGSWVRRAREDSLELTPSQGALAFSFTPAERAWGYLVVASAGDARTELLVPGERDRWADSALWNTPGPRRQGWLEIDAPSEIGPGERVTVSVEVPRPGWLLLSAETWTLHQHRWLRVEPGEQRWSFTQADFAPNVYVSALLVQDPHALGDGSWLPGRAQGIASIRMRPEPHQAGLEMSLPGEVAPRSTLTVDLAVDGAEGPTWVSVAAVDEGLVSLTDHPVPDPLASLFSKRALGVDTFETVGWSLALPSVPRDSAVGGDAAGRRGRIQAIEPVAVWSGLVPVSANGRARVELPLPSYRGALRVVAVAASPTRVATAHGSVPVREPLLVQASTPRFLIEGDQASIPVTIHNTSGVSMEMIATLSVEALEGAGDPPLELTGGTEHSATIAPGARAELLAALEATGDDGGAGGASLRVDARAGELHSWERPTIPVGALRPTEQRSQRVALQPGATELGGLLTGWHRHETELFVTSNPYADALSQLGSLLRYPYGCLEQTSSQTRVLIALGPMLEQLEPELAASKPTDRWVQDGVDRLQRMQTWGGGFGYWPGDSTPAPWASAYALHVLWDARQAGHAVPDQVIDDGLGYLARAVEGEDLGTHPYAHYVLALAGRGLPAKARAALPAHSDPAQRYLLMAAIHLAGDHRYAERLRSLEPIVRGQGLSRAHRYASTLGSQGMVLTAFRALFGHDDRGTALADAVAEGLRSRQRATTQELAWGLAGLAATVESLPTTELPLRLTRDGDPVEQTEPGRWRIAGTAEPSDLAIGIPNSLPEGLYLVLDTTGERTDGLLPISRGATIERDLHDEEGTILDPEDLQVGQLVYVRLRVTSQLGRQPRVALVERLPAGWELENPAVSGASLPGWADDGTRWVVEHRNLRDDRIESFGTLEPETSSLVYAARVATAGSFTWPGALLEAMYDPGVRARTGPTAVRNEPAADAGLL